MVVVRRRGSHGQEIEFDTDEGESAPARNAAANALEALDGTDICLVLQLAARAFMREIEGRHRRIVVAERLSRTLYAVANEGPPTPRSDLTAEEIAEAKRMLVAGERMQEVARLFRVSVSALQAHVGSIRKLREEAKQGSEQ
jgi:hypothetical protein